MIFDDNDGGLEAGDASGLAVLLNATSVPLRPVGAGKYIWELAKGLAFDFDTSLYLCTRKNDRARWENIMLDGRKNKLLPLAPVSKPARMQYEEYSIAKLATQIGKNNLSQRSLVLHGPHYVIGRTKSAAVVATIHDMTLLEHPEWHERNKVIYFTRAIGNAVRQAQVIICPSRYTAQKLLDRYHLKTPVVVARHGVDFSLFRPKNHFNLWEDKEALLEIGLSGRYILHVGTIEPRKNISLLAKAFDVLADKDQEVRLVLAGKEGWRVTEINKVLHYVKHKDRIVRLGYVQDSQVAVLLRNASVVCYPSFEEGFGLPALEAVACGAPLVTTRDSAMAEMVGKAAVLVNPGSLEDLTDALRQELEGGGDQELRRKSGLEIAGQFTWEKSLKNHLYAYRLALGG